MMETQRPNVMCTLLLAGSLALACAAPAIAGPKHPAPDDTFFDQQWGMENAGQSGGTPGADIGVLEAWDYSVGDTSVVVALVGSGLDMDHPDLAPSLWINWGECCTEDGIDDDENGYIDDFYGWDFHGDDNDPEHESNDDICHATHMAGIIAARTNNGLGVAGVAGGWGTDNTSGARLMVLRVSRPGNYDLAGISEAIKYAADNGAQIVVMGFGMNDIWGFGGDKRSIGAGDYAWNHGVLMLGSGGNTGCTDVSSCLFFGEPKTHPRVLAVGASNHDDGKPEPVDYSCCGDYINVIAPGGDVDLLSSMIASTTCYPEGPEGTEYKNGTAPAVSFAAGAAALALSVNPDLTNAELWTLIETTAERGGGTDGWDPSFGWGRLDAGMMMRALDYANHSGFTYSATDPQVFSPASNADAFEITVTVEDGAGDPVPGVPAYAIWATARDTARFGLCCADEETPDCVIDYENRVYADGPTDAAGQTTITIRAGYGADDRTPVRVRLYGVEITGRGQLALFPCISFDITGDCVVDAADMAVFRTSMGTSDYRRDFNHDGAVDAADSLMLVDHLGDACVPMASGEDPPAGQPDAELARLTLEAQPNPARDGVRIRYELPAGADAGEAPEIRIYDIGGRLVRALPVTPGPAGAEELVWDGTDDAGRRVAAGVYLCRAAWEGGLETRYLVLLR